jgi:putative aldouronate transport system substrate-binding protein
VVGTDPDPGWSINMRMDILKEFGYGEKAEKGESFTQAEFVDLLCIPILDSGV